MLTNENVSNDTKNALDSGDLEFLGLQLLWIFGSHVKYVLISVL